jgi:hypothetical protein
MKLKKLKIRKKCISQQTSLPDRKKYKILVNFYKKNLKKMFFYDYHTLTTRLLYRLIKTHF